MLTTDPPTSPEFIRGMTPLTNHDGLSGAELFRATLTDGAPVIVKRSHPDRDVFQRLLGHREGLELLLWREGVFAELPRGISSPTLGGWVEDGTTWIVMRDLGDSLVGPDHSYDESEVDRLLHGLTSMHGSGLRPVASTKLARAVGMFSSPRLARAGAPASLRAEVDRGWAKLRDLGSPGFADQITGLASDPRPLVAALAARPAGLVHGDVAGVNMAWKDDDLVLIDWGQAMIAPPAMDIARFLPSGLRRSAMGNDDLLERYRELAGSRFDAVGLELSLLAAFVWYGWRKVLDAVETEDVALRRVEADALQWWCDRVPNTLRKLP